MVQLQDNEFDLQSQIVEVSRTKTSCAHIDSGAPHHFFHSQNSFSNYSRISKDVMAASGLSRFVG